MVFSPDRTGVMDYFLLVSSDSNNLLFPRADDPLILFGLYPFDMSKLAAYYPFLVSLLTELTLSTAIVSYRYSLSKSSTYEGIDARTEKALAVSSPILLSLTGVAFIEFNKLGVEPLKSIYEEAA